MKKNSYASMFPTLPKQLIIGLSIVTFLILLIFIAQRTVSQSTDTKPLVAVVNINEKKESIGELVVKINTLPKTDINRLDAEKIIQRAFGTEDYATDVSSLSYSEVSQFHVAMRAGLIPLGIRIAELCRSQIDRTACKKDLGVIEDKIDIAERLVKYYSIMAHIPDLCVKIDLGMKPHFNATAIDDSTSRLNICTGAPGDIKFRAPAKNGKMVRVKESFTPDVALPYVKQATLCLLETQTTVKCKSEK